MDKLTLHVVALLREINFMAAIAKAGTIGGSRSMAHHPLKLLQGVEWGRINIHSTNNRSRSTNSTNSTNSTSNTIVVSCELARKLLMEPDETAVGIRQAFHHRPKVDASTTMIVKVLVQ